MKRTFLVLIIAAFGFASCNKEPQPMTKAEIRQKIDSITTVRIKESDAQAQKDLRHRIEIEVKVKADSIATTMMKQVKDTTTKPKAPALHVMGGV